VTIEGDAETAGEVKKGKKRKRSNKLVNIVSESQNRSGIMNQEKSKDGYTSEENEDQKYEN
jgi:hypothetical protein